MPSAAFYACPSLVSRRDKDGIGDVGVSGNQVCRPRLERHVSAVRADQTASGFLESPSKVYCRYGQALLFRIMRLIEPAEGMFPISCGHHIVLDQWTQENIACLTASRLRQRQRRQIDGEICYQELVRPVGLIRASAISGNPASVSAGRASRLSP
jgi:hypothetical protein